MKMSMKAAEWGLRYGRGTRKKPTFPRMKMSMKAKKVGSRISINVLNLLLFISVMFFHINMWNWCNLAIAAVVLVTVYV